jgi:putative PIN family toxin of toxin-antitoxin system
MIKVVIDTNVHVSAIAKPSSKLGRVIQLVLEGEVASVVSGKIIEEMRQTLASSKLKKYLKMNDHEMDRYVTSFQIISEEVSGEGNAKKYSRDLDDDKFIYAALEGGAQYIVSGDEDLLVLESIENVQIKKAADFLMEISGE